LEGKAGEDILFGDFGRVTREPALLTVEATSLFEGGDDEIETGSGGDIALGGAGGDVFWATFAEDSVVGDYGRFRIELSGLNETEQVISLVTLAQGRLDLLRSSQQDLYTNDGLTEREVDDVEDNNRVRQMLGDGETLGMNLRDVDVENATTNNPAIERMERLISEWQQREGSSLRGSIASQVAANVSSGGEAERMLQQNPPAYGEAEAPSAENAAAVRGDENTQVEDNRDEPTEDAEAQAELINQSGLEIPNELLTALTATTGWAIARAGAPTPSQDASRLNALRRECAARDWQRLSEGEDDEETA
ncbi:MAG: hypothetical protein ABR539_09130, partial [Halomonas sp.]